MICQSIVDEGSVSSDAEYSDNDDDDGYDEYYSFNDEEENRLLFQVIYTKLGRGGFKGGGKKFRLNSLAICHPPDQNAETAPEIRFSKFKIDLK